MRVLFLDLDTLRPDHLGCYGYKRNTSPNIDSVAKEAVVFDRYYCPNAPCLPSRASLVTGKYGIHTGVVGHGGTAADMRLQGAERDFNDELSFHSLIGNFRKAGLFTASVSTFAERHSAWWFNAGFNECHNVGKGGMESAEEVTPIVLDFIEKNADKDNWLLHVNYWDAHTPYRAPMDFGNPFENEPLPDDWIDEGVFEQHLKKVGPHGLNEINMWNDDISDKYKRHPGKIATRKELKDFMDNYDCGIKYMDQHIGKILDMLKNKGIYKDMAIIITSDHGENMGEMGIYGEHATTDEANCRIPMIIKWPEGQKGVVDSEFHANVDLAPTVADLLEVRKSKKWDGKSFAKTILNGEPCGHEYVILTQCAHVCQRAARFDDYLYIRTYHGGYHLFNKEMLFNIKEDPHQQHDIAANNPELCARGAKYILDWVDEMMATSDDEIDPLWTVMKEKGPYHTWGAYDKYIKRLEATGRGEGVQKLHEMYKND